MTFARPTQPAALAGFGTSRRSEPAFRAAAPRPSLLQPRREPQQLALFGPQRSGR